MTIAEGWVEVFHDRIHMPRSARLRPARSGPAFRFTQV